VSGERPEGVSLREQGAERQQIVLKQVVVDCQVSDFQALRQHQQRAMHDSLALEAVHADVDWADDLVVQFEGVQTTSHVDCFGKQQTGRVAFGKLESDSVEVLRVENERCFERVVQEVAGLVYENGR
jgi:hypothetical protein